MWAVKAAWMPCGSSPRPRTFASSSERSRALRSALLHAIGEEPTEALIEPGLESVEPVENEVKQGEHDVRCLLRKQHARHDPYVEREFVGSAILGRLISGGGYRVSG